MQSIDKIKGAEQVVAIFGYWPSFHDAEVLSLKLDRKGPLEAPNGPTLDALVHAFETTSEVVSDGYCALRHHVLVHLRFTEVVGLQMDGFNHQNVLSRSYC